MHNDGETGLCQGKGEGAADSLAGPGDEGRAGALGRGVSQAV
jgi:hypothetical protein